MKLRTKRLPTNLLISYRYLFNLTYLERNIGDCNSEVIRTQRVPTIEMFLHKHRHFERDCGSKKIIIKNRASYAFIKLFPSEE